MLSPIAFFIALLFLNTVSVALCVVQVSHKLFECTQREGQVLYVPTHWFHGVLNLAPSVGLAVEVGQNPHMLKKYSTLFSSKSNQ